MTPKYRSDIDGLRAVAVLSVLFFHSGLVLFSGGYVGVDVFFVISGYLITSIIVREIANNSFSIFQFYERRFRRILPALTAVVVAVLITGYVFLVPLSAVDLGQSAVATALFSSNIFFYLESGYFDTAAEMKPLLHTWSLAVEEQYYIFFPLLLVLIAKIDKRHYLRWLLAIGLCSFIACIILTGIDASASFYLILTRAWELLIGSIIALNVLPSPQKRFYREILTLSGMAMIAISVFWLTSETKFPGFAAALPTIGTALIIHSGIGGHSFVANVLSLRPVVFIGLISYSLYLWHWPVIVYTKIISIREPSEPVLAVMIVLIFSLSTLSWKYVEAPFRKKEVFKERRALLTASALVSLIIVVIGSTFIVNNGYPHRFTSDVTMGDDLNDSKWKRWWSCEKVVDRLKEGQGLCDIGKEDERHSFILWGDSHGRAIASGIDLSARNIGLRGKIATQSACPPLLFIERPNRTSCNEFNQAVLGYISAKPELETVVLAARWALSTKGVRYKKESGNPVRLFDLGSKTFNNLSNIELFEIGLKRTIEKLHSLGKKVVLVNPVPEVGYDVPSAVLIANITGREVNSLIAPTLEEYEDRTKEVTSVFRGTKEQMFVELVAPEIYLCDASYCKVALDDIPLYRDDDHLSTFGAEYVSQAFDKVFSDIAMRVKGLRHLANQSTTTHEHMRSVKKGSSSY